MRKQELIREVRDVMSGNSGHTVIVFGKNANNKWDTYTTINNLYKIYYPEWRWCQIQRHCCNEMTLKEAAEIVNNAERFLGGAK